MQLQFLETIYSICQFEPSESIPDWANDFLAVIRTDDELTVIAPTSSVTQSTKAQHDFVCFRVVGQLEFDVIGVIAAISKVLADAEIPILSISTYNTDYFLIAVANQVPARSVLLDAGYKIRPR